jgi:hypothetical protein
MKTLADLKVGDAVWTLQDGYTEVSELCPKNEYPIRAGKGAYQKSYTIDGRINNCHKYQSLFLDNPFDKKAESKLMLVSTGTSDWVEKPIIIDSITNRIFVMSDWEFYKEIEPEETLSLAIAEISLEQIAEKFGVDVEQIRIKP